MKNLTIIVLSAFCSLMLSGQNVKTYTMETWTNGAWQNFSMSSYTYDGNNFLTNNQGHIWDVPLSSWKLGTQISYINNGNGSVQQSTLQSWDSQANTWNNLQRYSYTYSNSSGVCDKDNSELKIFPNPCSDFLNVILSQSAQTKISIINFNGHSVFSQVSSGNEFKIRVGDLEENIYILVIEREDKQITKRFIKL